MNNKRFDRLVDFLANPYRALSGFAAAFGILSFLAFLIVLSLGPVFG